MSDKKYDTLNEIKDVNDVINRTIAEIGILRDDTSDTVKSMDYPTRSRMIEARMTELNSLQAVNELFWMAHKALMSGKMYDYGVYKNAADWLANQISFEPVPR